MKHEEIDKEITNMEIRFEEIDKAAQLGEIDKVCGK